MIPRFLRQSSTARQRCWTVYGLLFILAFYFTRCTVDDQPPTYKTLREWEADLPQHNLDLPFPEGRTGRYVLFKNQLGNIGWSNVLDEV